MEQRPDYYQILGVLPNSEDVVIRGVYRALMQKYHPDTFSGDPEESERRTRELNEAYSVLRDPEARSRYDAGRAAWTGPLESTAARSEDSGSPSPNTAPPPPSMAPARAEQVSLEGLLHRFRHALITAAYIAAVLLIFVAARAVLTMKPQTISNSAPTPQIVAANKMLAAKQKASRKPAGQPISPPSTHQAAKPSSPPDVRQAQPAREEPAQTASPASSVEAAAQTSAISSASPAARSIKSSDVSQYASRHKTRKIGRRAHWASQSLPPVQGRDAESDNPTDEAQTRWLNSRSATSRPRWHPSRNWQRYTPP